MVLLSSNCLVCYSIVTPDINPLDMSLDSLNWYLEIFILLLSQLFLNDIWHVFPFHITCTGGVRGAAFIHSPLLESKGRVSLDLMHVTDWLPTLYALAGGSASKLRNVDGYNVWDTLSSGKSSPRQELLHNIHPSGGEAAMRYGQWKILVNAGENNEDVVWCRITFLLSTYKLSFINDPAWRTEWRRTKTGNFVMMQLVGNPINQEISRLIDQSIIQLVYQYDNPSDQ